MDEEAFLASLRRCWSSDEYTIIKQISKGSYGDVYLAERHLDSKRVCLKQVDLDFLSAHERLGCVEEIRLLRSLPHHPHIVQCFDAFVETAATPENTCLMLVLEYGDAGDLDMFIQSSLETAGSIPVENALQIVAQIASGLAFLHSNRILHRDIKSKNVFRFSDGRVAIGDFGTSKSLTQTTALAHTLVGSPLYMSPELLDGHAYSYPSDVWSLGCVLYEVLAGHTPFLAASYPAVVFKISKGVYDPLAATIPAEVAQLVASMLALDPQKRPTMDEILAMPVVRNYVDFDLAAQVYSSHESPTQNVSAPVTEVPVLLPPPAPVLVAVTPAPLAVHEASIVPVPPPPPAPVIAKAKPTDQRQSQAIYPTSRASLANILSRERLHVHRQRRSELETALPTNLLSCVPVLDATGVERPPTTTPQRGMRMRPATTTSKRRPGAAVPPDTMMVIGKKVDSVLKTTRTQR